MSKNTSLKNLDNELLENIKSTKPWYTKTIYSMIALFFLAVIDVGGFAQGLFSKLPDLSKVSFAERDLTILAMAIMIFGFIASFEIATLYMAYAFSLKLYHYDKYAIKRINQGDKNVKFSKFISTTSLGWISFAAFVIGIIANIIFRFGLLGNKSLFDNKTGKLTYDGALMIVMIMMPIITSIINFVIGCFSFDPILYELSHLTRTLRKTSIDIEKLEKEKEMINDEIIKVNVLRLSQESLCNSKMTIVQSMKPALRTRIYEEAIKDV